MGLRYPDCSGRITRLAPILWAINPSITQGVVQFRNSSRGLSKFFHADRSEASLKSPSGAYANLRKCRFLASPFDKLRTRLAITSFKLTHCQCPAQKLGRRQRSRAQPRGGNEPPWRIQFRRSGGPHKREMDLRAYSYSGAIRWASIYCSSALSGSPSASYTLPRLTQGKWRGP